MNYHYERACQLLTEAAAEAGGYDSTDVITGETHRRTEPVALRMELIARAQVHATLAAVVGPISAAAADRIRKAVASSAKEQMRRG